MHAAVDFFDTGAFVNLTHSALVTLGWRNCVKKEVLIKLRTATEIQVLIMLYLRLGVLSALVWFTIGPQGAVHMLLCTAFIERFIRKHFSSKKMVATLRSPRVAILANQIQGFNANDNGRTHKNPKKTNGRGKHINHV